MRQFVIDELSARERDNLDSYLTKSLKKGAMEGVYWLEMPRDLWAETQQGHDECGPFYCGLELGRDRLTIELLIRSESNLHCSCIAYATAEQRRFILDFIDTMLDTELVSA